MLNGLYVLGDLLLQNIMLEATREVVRFAFCQLLLYLLESNVITRNVASIKPIEKAGFEYEGHFKKYLLINGIWEDHLHHALTNKEMQ